VPPEDPGRFNLLVTQAGATVAEASNVGDGGSTGRQRLPFGAYEVGEQAAGATNLADYATSITCVNEDTGQTVLTHEGAGPAPVTLDAPDVVCVIQNVHTPRVATLTVVKHLVPSDDPGLFDLVIGGTAWAEAVGDRGTTGPLEFGLGRHKVGERAAAGTDLADYSIRTTCRNHGRVVARARRPSVSVRLKRTTDDVVCTITNRRESLPPGNGGGSTLPPGGGGTGTIPPDPCHEVDSGIPECGDPTTNPNLVVTKRMPARARVGQRVRFTITVRNVGRGSAEGVRLHETPARGNRLLRVSRRGAIRSDGTAVWSLGRLAPGARRTVRATVRVTRTGLLTDTAVAAPGNADPAFDVAAVRARHRARPPSPPPVVTG
jgi:uncharacterized repeat protein (TIGR01451 family)